MTDVSSIVGTWNLQRDKSAEVGRFGPSRMEIKIVGDTVEISRWFGRGTVVDLLACRTDGVVLSSQTTHRAIPETVLSGIYRSMTDECTTLGTVDSAGDLRIQERCTYSTSQGTCPATVSHVFHLADEGRTIIHTLGRSTRPHGREARYVYTRAPGQRQTTRACYMELGENWEIEGDLPQHAALISLQGTVNRDSPELYFVYPANWDFKFTQGVLDFLRSKRSFDMRKLEGFEQALDVFCNRIYGYVVWDTEVRTSLIVAFTIAGLENAIVVTDSQIDQVARRGLREVIDLRGRFTGMSDADVYRWAYERYWDRCSRDCIVWLGGEHGKTMKPGVADWGMFKQAFFTDLSARETDEEEYSLATKMLSEQNPHSMVFGWHSYKKDTEGEHVTLTSSFGLRMEGLHTLPNMSFSSQIPASEGFVFQNNHNVLEGKRYDAAPKVYIACVQTDCLGIGAWTEPGRGEIPYAWEVTMNWVWLAPAMMEFFYTQSTPNDYFIGALSGPGYMYPRAVPPELLPGLVRDAYDLMQRLDLRVFDIMDFSKIRTPGGTPDLPPDIVDVYYREMPEAIGFVNGYYPARTFTVKDGRPFISFDYYLSPTRSEEDAEADIVELATVNPKRPYFLLMHVRNFSDIRRVIRILNRLPEEFEVLPLDTFITMAGENWTFDERFAGDAGSQRYPLS